MYQLVLLWKAAFGFSEFFWRLFQCICPCHDGWFRSACAHTTLSVQQFLTKNGMIPMPPLSIFSQSCPKRHLLFPQIKKKSPQREMFCQYGKGETKNSRSTKTHQNRWVWKLFWAVGKKVSIGVLYQMEDTLKVTEVLICKNEYTHFINKFQSWGGPSSYLQTC